MTQPVESVTSLGRRERKKRRTREDLVKNALRLFDANGYENTTVAAITEAVDVSTSTFFGYFMTKEDVVFAGYEERIAELASELEHRPDDETTIAAIARHVVSSAAAPSEVNEHHALRIRIITGNATLREARRRRITALLETSLRRCYARDLGVDPGSTGPKVLAAMTAAGLCTLSNDFFTRLADGDPGTKRVVLEQFETLRQGIEGAYEALSAHP